MMNKVKKILLLIGCVLFVSCGNFSTSDNEEIPAGKGKLCISTDLDSQSRSVLPTAIEEDTMGFSWKLVGTCGSKTFSKNWSDSDDKSKSAYKLMTSDVAIYIDVGTWNFTLTVYNDDNQKVLSSMQTSPVEIKAGETTPISFVMQEASGSDVAAGSIDFTLKIPGGFEGMYVASLYKLNETNATDTKDGRIESSITSIIYSNDNISAGYYRLHIDLQQNTGDATASSYKTINTYTCLIRVAPGLCSKGDYTLNSLAPLYTISYKWFETDAATGELIEKDVTFGSTETIITSYNAYTSFNLPEPTRVGYEFAGWYTDETYDNPASNDGTYKINSDTTLYAKWVEAVSGITHANNTLYISSYEGLKVFRDIVNGSLANDITIPGDTANSGASVTCNARTSVTDYNAELQSNITINEDWTPIGMYTDASSQVPYVGKFNGNNNTITFGANGANVSINSQAAGLFGAISSDCNIYNLIIEGNIQSSSTSTAYAGGIVGFANGGSVQNCVNKAKIQNASSAGGIAGKAQNTSFNGCVNFGEITGTNYSAGIVGAAASGTSIDLCINVGKLTSNTTACGISGDAPINITVQNCINLGTLLASSNIYGISSVDSTSQDNIISCNISAGKFEGTVQYNCYAVCSSATDTNYYDSSICSSFSTVNNVESMETSQFSNWSPNDGIFWSADVGRYPLPNISSNIPADIWNEICDAAEISVSDPIEGTPVANENELTSAINDASVDTIIISESFTISSCINISRSVTIAANADVTVTNNVSSDNMFFLMTGGNLTLGGGGGLLTFSKGSTNYAAIATSTQNNVSVSINIKDKVKFTNGSYYWISFSAGTGCSLNIYGGEFVGNNKVPIYINNVNATCNMTGGLIYDNSNDVTCAGIYVNQGKLYITGGTIKDNTVTNNTNLSGSSIRAPSASGGTVTINGTTITASTTYTNAIIDGIPQE